MIHDTNPGFTDRVLAEAVRAEEEAQGFLHSDAVVAPARGPEGLDLEQRLVLRARNTPNSKALRHGLQRARAGLLLASGVACLAGAFGGSGTAAAALGTGSGAPVNVYLALGALLGVNLLALAGWTLLVAFRPTASATTSVGGLVWFLSHRLGRWVSGATPEWSAVIKALAVTANRSGAGRWGLSAISHAFWTVFLGAAVITTLFLLGSRQYILVWETTILSAESFVPLTRTLAAVPAALGFPVPGLQDIEASRWTGPGSVATNAAEAWSGFLVGSLLAYGLLPRALLLVLCVALTLSTAKRYRLDLDLPAYAMAAKQLEPAARRLGVSDADRAPQQSSDTHEPPSPAAVATRALGPIAVVGLEIEPPASGWPPAAGSWEWLDLGLVDSREQRQAGLARLAASLPPPRMTVAVCSLTVTPDRGSRRFLAQLAEDRPASILLTGGDRLRRQGASESVARRVEDWRAAATSAGITADKVLEIDLDNLTAVSSRGLLAFLTDGAGTDLSRPTDDLDRLALAFNAIYEAAAGWRNAPEADDQAELHSRIARIYADRGEDWKSLLGVVADLDEEPLNNLRSSAERMLALLPERLRSDRKWIASGAIAGALACTAAATLAAPAALAALPIWAGAGGALSMLLRERLAGEYPAQGEHSAIADFGEAVRAAALFAVLLELQGLEEARITLTLDRLFETQVPTLRTAAEIKSWLDTTRERLTVARAAS